MINLELFSCAGGMAEGFRRAGILFDMAVDKAPDHVDSYALNLGHRPVQMDATDLLRMARMGWRVPVRLLVADPPCTPWSRAGKRKGLTDQRDMLRETAELISLLRPQAYLIGNVPGLEDSPNLGTVQDVIGGLARSGYCVADFCALDAADYGVPQHRVRPFWFGHLHGPCIQWPLPTHGDPEVVRDLLPGVDPLAPWVTCGQALAHLTGKELGRMVRLRKRSCSGKQHFSVPGRPARVVGTSNLSDGNVVDPALLAPQKRSKSGGHHPSHVDQPAKTVLAGDGGGARRAILLGDQVDRQHREDRPARTLTTKNRHSATVLLNDRHKPAEIDKPAPTMLAKVRGNSAQMLSLASTRPAYRASTQGPQSQRTVSADGPATTLMAREDRQGSGMVLEWPWPRPATTLQRDARLAPPGHHDRQWASRSKNTAVLISERAAAILQGFPETWVFSGKTKKTRWSQLGQAMPPPLAHAVARSVAAQLAATVDQAPPERFVPWSPAPPRPDAGTAEQLLLTGTGGRP